MQPTQLRLGPFKRPPRAKQLEALQRSIESEWHALFMEQRTGKTQVALETLFHHHRHNGVNLCFVVAPNGVHRNWITDELPAVQPDDVKTDTLVWRSNKSETKGYREQMANLLRSKNLVIFAINIEAIILKRLREFMGALLRGRKAMLIVDEALDIGTPGAKQTRVVLNLARRCAVRRLLEGQPLARGPLAVWSMFEALKPGVLGFPTHMAFKHYYAEWETGYTGPVGDPQTRTFQKLVKYRNIEDLHKRMAPHMYRVLRSECADLPPKVYQKRYFALSDKQRGMYNDMRKVFMAELSNGDTVSAPQVLTRRLRLAQIASNFMPATGRLVECPACHGGEYECDTCEGYGMVADKTAPDVPIDPKHNPRLEALMADVEKLDGKGLIWCRFKHDAALVCDALAALTSERSVARYDGSIPLHLRKEQEDFFQKGSARYMVGHVQAGGRGLDFSAASWVAYYSHDSSLLRRLQSEDRAQNLSKTEAVLYLDYIAEDTVDESTVDALRKGRNLSDTILRDPKEKWL